MAAAEGGGEPRRGEGREEEAGGGVGAEQVAGGGLLPEGGPPPALGATGEEARDLVPRRLDQASGGIGDQDPAADGQDAGGPSEWAAGLLRRDDHVGPDGGHEQQDQDDEAAGVRVPRQGVLQAEDPGDPRDEIRIGRMTSCRWITGLRALPPDEPERLPIP